MIRRSLAIALVLGSPLASIVIAGETVTICEIRALPDGDAPAPVATQTAPAASGSPTPAQPPVEPRRPVERVALADAPNIATPAPSARFAPSAGRPKFSPAMAAVIQQAEVRNRQGLDLANRGAHFSARAEFIKALRLIAEGLDSEQGTSEHRQALANAIRALEEAEDLVPRGSAVEGDIDVAAVTRSHRTPALKNGAEANPAFALQRYYAYAEEQFSAAIGGAQAGSMSLYALGKLHGLFALQRPPVVLAADAKAVVYYQAALLTDPANYLAANDLGVQLAKAGRYEQARALLVSAAQTQPQAATWHNLAVVHSKLGEPRLADLAHKNELAASGGLDMSNLHAVAATQAVRWVDPKTFASAAKPATDMPATGKTDEPGEKKPETPVVRKPAWMSWGLPKQGRTLR